VFLKNRAPHTWSRIFLLASAAIPLVIPFVTFPATQMAKENAIISEVTLPLISISNTANKVSHWDYSIILWIMYFLMSFVLLVRFFLQYFRIKHFIAKNKKENVNGVSLMRNTGFGPGSWGKNIFFPADEVDPVILNHELTHVAKKHAYDVVFISLLQCFLWPDIFLFFIAKELKIVHEFQADAEAVDDKERYTYTLLNQAFGTKQFSYSHTFFHNPLKRRIMMLQKPGTKRYVIFTSLIAILGLFTAIIYFQSCSKGGNESQHAPTYLDTLYKAMKEGNYTIHLTPDSVKKMPEFNGNINTYIAQHLKYPKSAIERNIEGRVIVQFVIDRYGRVLFPDVVRSPDTSLSNAALAVIKGMPKWIPGEDSVGEKTDVKYNLPISFKLH